MRRVVFSIQLTGGSSAVLNETVVRINWASQGCQTVAPWIVRNLRSTKIWNMSSSYTNFFSSSSFLSLSGLKNCGNLTRGSTRIQTKAATIRHRFAMTYIPGSTKMSQFEAQIVASWMCTLIWTAAKNKTIVLRFLSMYNFSVTLGCTVEGGIECWMHSGSRILVRISRLGQPRLSFLRGRWIGTRLVAEVGFVIGWLAQIISWAKRGIKIDFTISRRNEMRGASSKEVG